MKMLPVILISAWKRTIEKTEKRGGRERKEKERERERERQRERW